MAMFEGARTRKKMDTELPMAPLIDCVFLLLIFFMVATVMRVNPPFPVTLPDSQTRHEFPRKKFNLHISAGGQIAIDDRIMPTLDDLEEYLAINEHKIETLIIKADKNAVHGLVIDCMERAKRRAIDTLAIAIKEGQYTGTL
jgi:biopolymer transport protein ExbD